MENQRVFLASALAVILLMMWQEWEQDYPSVETDNTFVSTQSTPDNQSLTQPQTGDQEVPNAPVDALIPRAEAAANSIDQQQRIRVITDLLDVEIDTAGGDIRKVGLIQHHVSLEDDSPMILMNDFGNEIFIAQSGLLTTAQTKQKLPTHKAVFQSTREHYRLEEGESEVRVPITWTQDNIKVTKTFIFYPHSYTVDIEYNIQGFEGELPVRLYSQFQRSRPESSMGSNFIYTYTGGVIYDDKIKYEKVDFDDMDEKPLSRDLDGGWSAMIQHYFLAAWLPEQGKINHYYSKALGNDLYMFGVMSPLKTISAENNQLTTRLYMGPKEQKRLEKVAEGLKLTVDYGVLTFIAQPIFWLLHQIHDIVKNWGWAIIFVTVLIKLLFYKLSETSYKSMASMRRLQPRLQTLKERYGEDKAKMQQKLMELYKTEKINPMGGCLPVLLQIPVFISLYWVLLESVELRQAPFMLWINDLSSQDPYYILPLLMGATMLIQQKLNPAPMDPIQQKVMMALPIVFTVFFIFFPAGLVLYWVVNNALSIIQQSIIIKRVEAEKK